MNKSIPVVFLLTLFTLSAFACKDTTQIQGNCTECGSGTETLVSGYCYQRITGCLNYTIGPVCIRCQNGYVLVESSCIRMAVFLGNTDLSPAPIVAENAETLRLEQIRDRMSEMYGSDFVIVNDYVLGQQKSLTIQNVQSVTNLTTIKGRYIVIRYKTADQKQYIASAFVNKLKKIQQPQFQQLMPATMGSDPISIVELLNRNYQLTGFNVYQIRDQYIIDYLNIETDYAVVRFEIKKNEINSVPESQLLATIRRSQLGLNDLALEEILKAYPYFQGETIKFVNKGNGLLIFFFGVEDSVSVQFKNDRFIINRPIFTPIRIQQQPATQLILGGFSPFRQLASQAYMESQQYIRSQFPELESAIVIQVQSQAVAGTNFLVTFQQFESGYQYVIKVYRNLSGEFELIEGIKFLMASPGSTMNIYSKQHNYNTDELFLEIYPQMLQKSRISNDLPIESVIRKQTKDQIYYRVQFSKVEYMDFHIVGKQARLLGYYAENQRIDILFDVIIPVIGAQSVAVTPVFVKTPIAVAQIPTQVCSNSLQPHYNIITTTDITLDSLLLRSKVANQIRSLNTSWSSAILVVILESPSHILAYINNRTRVIEITLDRATLSLQKHMLLPGSIDIFHNNQLANQFRFTNLLIPKSTLTTQRSLNLLSEIAVLSSQILEKQIQNPTIVSAAQISVSTYRLLVSTDLSPSDPERKYYVKFDVYVSASGFAQFFGVERILAQDFIIPKCSQFGKGGICLSCKEGQFENYGQCFEKLKNCRFQILSSCVTCEQNYISEGHQCVKRCDN